MEQQSKDQLRPDRQQIKAAEKTKRDRHFKAFMFLLAGTAIFTGLVIGAVLNPSGKWHFDLTRLVVCGLCVAGGVGGYQWMERMKRRL